jgi:hypothetical protein
MNGNEQLATIAAPDQAGESTDPRKNPALAEDMAYAEKPDRDRAHALGKMVTEVQVTPENTEDEDEYVRKRLDPVESLKDYSGSLIKAKEAAEHAANVRSTQVNAEYRRERAEQRAR